MSNFEQIRFFYGYLTIFTCNLTSFLYGRWKFCFIQLHVYKQFYFPSNASQYFYLSHTIKTHDLTSTDFFLPPFYPFVFIISFSKLHQTFGLLLIYIPHFFGKFSPCILVYCNFRVIGLLSR